MGSALRTALWLSSPLRSCRPARSSTQTELEMPLLVASSPNMSLARTSVQQSGAASGGNAHHPEIRLHSPTSDGLQGLSLNPICPELTDLYFYNSTSHQYRFNMQK